MTSSNKQGIVARGSEIKNLILTVRDKQVLLDSDVAQLYGYDTKRVNETAARNSKRFPTRFRFQLTEEEVDEILRSQFATSNKTDTPGRGGRRYKPYVYTEQGVAMLSGLLKNDIAIQVSLSIMDAFVEMRQFLSTNKEIYAKLINMDNKILEHDHKFDQVFDLLQSSEETPNQSIFYKGQFYDAFRFIVDIIKKAEKDVILIDNYIDDSVFDILVNKKDGVSTTIVTSNPERLSQAHSKKFSKQYGAVSIVACKDFHDRFVIVDRKEVYAFGASLKDLGNKCFEVSKNEDTGHFLSYINKVIESNKTCL